MAPRPPAVSEHQHLPIQKRGMSTNHPGAIERTLRVADHTPGTGGRHIRALGV